VSLAALAASTDLTSEGQAHNIFKSGERLSRYAVARLGKEFAGGRNRFNVMQTAVLNTADRDTYGDFASREAYTTGLDFDLNSKNRDFNAQGSFVGSIIDPEQTATDPTITGKPVYGTGGALDLRRRGGKLQGGLSGRWEAAKLQINDMGYSQAPGRGLVERLSVLSLRSQGEEQDVQSRRAELNLWKSWIYAGRSGRDIVTGAEAWRVRPQASAHTGHRAEQLGAAPELLGGLGRGRVQRRGHPSVRDARGSAHS
jgi:hypothetical protein